MSNKILITSVVFITAVCMALGGCGKKASAPPEEAARPAAGTEPTEPDEITGDYPDGLYAEIHTEKGIIVCSLEYEKAPLTVANFVGLAEGTIYSKVKTYRPFYDGLTFHRVDRGDLIQGGCPLGTGAGYPGYYIPNEIVPELKHDKAGVLAMAQAERNKVGCQFYIILKAMPHLDGEYSIFGHVVKGLNVARKIKIGDKIEKVVIVRVGEKANAFKTDQAAFDKLLAEHQQ